MGRPRGQFFAVDAVFALLLVLFVLLAASVVSTLLDAQARDLEATARLTERATDALNQLLRTPGYPTDWFLLGSVDNTTLDSLGLAYEPNVLDPNKTARFFNLTNTPQGLGQARTLLGLQEPGYNFSIVFLYANNSVAYRTLYPNPVERRVTASVERVALLNRIPLRTRLTLWLEPLP